MLDLSTFVEEYITIKTLEGSRKLDDYELSQIREYQKMTDSGLSLKMIKTRIGTRLKWCK